MHRHAWRSTEVTQTTLFCHLLDGTYGIAGLLMRLKPQRLEKFPECRVKNVGESGLNEKINKAVHKI